MTSHSDGLRLFRQAATMDTNDSAQHAAQNQDPAATVPSTGQDINPGPYVRFVPTTENNIGQHPSNDQSELEPYHELLCKESSNLVSCVRIRADPRDPCYLFRLPVNIRLRIYAMLFFDDGGSLEIGRQKKRTRIGNVAILRTCHDIYHEASLALYHALTYRKLYLRGYGAFPATLLRRRPLKLRKCQAMFTGKKWSAVPCLFRELKWKRSFNKVVFVLGSSDFNKAVRRRWDFSIFITTLRMAEPLNIYSLTIAVSQNWKIPGFNEEDLVEALLSGAIKYLGKLSFWGFTKEERERIYQLIRSKEIPSLKIYREVKLIQP